MGRLFAKFEDAVRFVDLHHAKLIALFQVDGNAADCAVGLVVDVLLHDLRIIHLVDVVAGEDQHVVGRVFSIE